MFSTGYLNDKVTQGREHRRYRVLPLRKCLSPFGNVKFLSEIRVLHHYLWTVSLLVFPWRTEFRRSKRVSMKFLKFPSTWNPSRSGNFNPCLVHPYEKSRFCPPTKNCILLTPNFFFFCVSHILIRNRQTGNRLGTLEDVLCTKDDTSPLPLLH